MKIRPAQECRRAERLLAGNSRRGHQSDLTDFRRAIEAERQLYHPDAAAGVDQARANAVQAFHVLPSERWKDDGAEVRNPYLSAMGVSG